MLAREKNTLLRFGFGDAWGDGPAYKKYIATDLYKFVMMGWKGGPNHATLLDDLSNGYGRFVRGILHPTLSALNHHDAMLSSLMHPRLLRMLWNNLCAVETGRNRHILHALNSELIKMDDVALIEQYMPITCVCGTGAICYYDIVLTNMGPAVYKVVKPCLMIDNYVGHRMGINDINLLVLNDRCDAFQDVFTKMAKEQALYTVQGVLSRAVWASNMVAVRLILDSGLVTSVMDYVGSWELFRTYNAHTLEIGKLLVKHGYDPSVDEEIIRKMVRCSDDLGLLAWMLGLAAEKRINVDRHNVALTAIAHDRKGIWRWLISHGVVYTTDLANMAAIHGHMHMLEEMHKAGVDCQRAILSEIHPIIPRALEAWIMRYGV